MNIQDMTGLEAGQSLSADLVIIGGGPAGITLAREFAGTDVSVLLLESGGLKETTETEALNAVESIGEPSSAHQIDMRNGRHAPQAEFWSQEVQPYGVRCRALGGSSMAWAGKSAAFDEIDFAERDWVPLSGWPMSRASLEPYLDRAAEWLNLGPNLYDASFWEAANYSAPKPHIDDKLLSPFFWQFAKSRIDAIDVMRFGDEFAREKASNIQVLLNATATRLISEDGTEVSRVEFKAPGGETHHASGKRIVLAASGIENPRLLLASEIGNTHDQVGRYLMDHPLVRIARVEKKQTPKLHKRFGFFALNHKGRAHMYMHGLTPSVEVQSAEKLNNCALYMLEDRAPDDPLEALKRLLKFRSKKVGSDLFALLKSPGMLIKAFGMKILQSGATPGFIKNLIVNTVIIFNPNFVAREFLSGGLPHKLLGLNIEGICEQVPDPDSRITLSETKDKFGVPLAKVDWKIDTNAKRSLARLAELMREEFLRTGLPEPTLEDWIVNDRPEDATIIDVAHTLGTTRMSVDPATGVVDANCRVHGMENLYVTGGSVFPTSGHANPTLMLLSLTVRLADHLKEDLAKA